jgi:hypothetical protein
MSWAKIDDQLHAHRKVVALGDQMLPALGLHLLALSWCASQLTDGYLPKLQIRRLAPDAPAALVDALVAAELWDRADGGYQIHDYLDWNPSREWVLEEREKAKVRMNRIRTSSARSPEVRPNIVRTNAEHLPEVRPLPVPVPDPLPDTEEKHSRAKRARPRPPARPAPTESDWEAFWDLYPKRTAPAAARKALEKALRVATLEEILAGLKKQLPEWRTKDPQFIPHPSTWLNQERWKDEIKVGFRPEPTRSTVPPPEPPMTPEEQEANRQAALEALATVRKMSAGIGRPMP